MDASRSITATEVEIAGKNNTVTAVRIVKLGEIFTVYLHLTWRPDEVFITTTRDRKTPKRFKHLGRLIEYIENLFPNVKSLQFDLGGTEAPD